MTTPGAKKQLSNQARVSLAAHEEALAAMQKDLVSAKRVAKNLYETAVSIQTELTALNIPEEEAPSVASDGFGVDGDETPTELIPKMGEFPVSNSVFYKQLVFTGEAGTAGSGKPLTAQLDPFADDDWIEERPAVGVLLTLEQGWFQEGLALGELRKSLSLAPGEVTKLALVDWRRATRSQEDSDTRQDERTTSKIDDSSVAESVQTAVAREARTGMSSESGSAQHAEGGAQVGALIWSASTSASRNAHQGYTATSETGTREASSSAAKAIERTTAQQAQSTRSVRATQVREVTEKEQQSTTTRVVANYNHAHALTMQYFEVLQIYSVRTRVANADRCVFIPMKPLEFTEAGLSGADDSVIELLRRVLVDLGQKKVDDMVGNFIDNSKVKNAIQEDETARKQIARDLETFEARMASVNQKLQEAGMKTYKLRCELAGKDGYDPLPAYGPRLAQLPVELAEAEGVEYKAQKEQQAVSLTAGATRTAYNEELVTIEARLVANRATVSEFGRMFGVLDEHRVLLNQQMWMRIDEYTWHRKLIGTTYPEAPYEGQAIGALVDPTPVGYFGNYVAFGWDFPKEGVGVDSKTSAAQAEAFEEMHTKDSSTSTRIALPTEGVFAEAVLGLSNCAEKIDITRFWNWADSPIPILPPSMDPVSTGSRARDVAAPAPLSFADAVAELRKAGVPDSIDDSAIVSALQQSIGDDKAALIKAAGDAGQGASQNAGEGAGRAGQRGVDAMKNMQDFTVGLANSEAAKIATEAAVGGATGGVSSIGGLLNAASDVSKVADKVDG